MSNIALDIAKMSPADAQHNLQVLAWLFAHQEELKERATDNVHAVSITNIQEMGGFNAWRATEDEDQQINVSVRRFLPVEILVESNDLVAHPSPAPCVSLKFGENEAVYPDDEDDIIVISRSYGIDPEEPAWSKEAQ